MFLPDEVDPNTIKLNHPSRVREFLDQAKTLMAQEAKRLDCYMMGYHEEGETIRIKSMKRKDFEEALFQCPRMADKAFEDSEGTQRPLPSIIGLPDGTSVVSKPSLCDGCSWNLYRATHGNCHGKQFDQVIKHV